MTVRRPESPGISFYQNAGPMRAENAKPGNKKKKKKTKDPTQTSKGVSFRWQGKNCRGRQQEKDDGPMFDQRIQLLTAGERGTNGRTGARTAVDYKEKKKNNTSFHAYGWALVKRRTKSRRVT